MNFPTTTAAQYCVDPQLSVFCCQRKTVDTSPISLALMLASNIVIRSPRAELLKCGAPSSAPAPVNRELIILRVSRKAQRGISSRLPLLRFDRNPAGRCA